MKSLYAVIVSVLFLSATQKAEAKEPLFEVGAVAGSVSLVLWGIANAYASDVAENYREKELLIKKKKALEKKLHECPACQIAYDDIVKAIKLLDKKIYDAPKDIFYASYVSIWLAFLSGGALALNLMCS